MRSLCVLIGLCSAAAGADEPYEIFLDRGETYMRAGTQMGLELGAMVTVWGDPIPTTKERRRAGTATVMEIWPSLARINLDDAARNDKAAKKFASFEPKKRAPVPAPSAPPPPPPAAAPPPAAPAPVAAADAGVVKKPTALPPGTPPVIKGHATFKGAGPWMVLTLWNDEEVDWHNCSVSLPGNLVYQLKFLRARDHESIALSNFVQSGPERDVPKDSVTVRCPHGAARYLFPPD